MSHIQDNRFHAWSKNESFCSICSFQWSFKFFDKSFQLKCLSLHKCHISRYLYFCIFCIIVLLFYMDCFNFRVWHIWFVVYIWILVCYDFASGGISLLHLLRETRICLRLSSTFPLWPWQWASPHQPSHLGSEQTTMSMTDYSCYCHYDDYFSGSELQCWPMIIKSLP